MYSVKSYVLQTGKYTDVVNERVVEISSGFIPMRVK